MSIHVLNSEIVNQIAAGEVVERPAHLVKELVENSLDAKATTITVEVSEGGRNIRVIDNGKGILSSELNLALQRHATSKISETNDLWNLNTFGFRGEALASAAAVSKLTLKSVQAEEKIASQIISNFGKLSQILPSSQSVGTEITIQNLFENVPARLKFLKTDSGELGQIKNVMKALALAHFNVEFKLISSGDLQLFYKSQNNKIDRVCDVLEKKSLFESHFISDDFNCHVVFSSPHDVAKTSRQIWIFAQNRWVQDRALTVAVQDAYRSLLMHGEYPYVVVQLNCRPDLIDVNIHPTKSQVKFQDQSSAFKTVHTTLRKALEKAPWSGSHQNSLNADHATVEFKANEHAQNLKFNDSVFDATQFKNKNFQIGFTEFEKLKISDSDIAGLTKNNFFEKSLSHKSDYNLKETNNLAENIKVDNTWSSLQVIGQANLTYIVCQKSDSLVYIDQHAAHERVVYETLMQAWLEKKFEIQNYLFPLTIDLSEEKVEALLLRQNEISEMGFEIEQMGPQSIGIKSAPSIIKDESLPPVFEKMANDLIQNGGSLAIEKKISDLYATIACHSVIRAGQSLSVLEMQELLRSMDQFALSSFCPHGRPVSVETRFTELEKQFGRIN
jgi:DNA mismatch repair protein MutL